MIATTQKENIKEEKAMKPHKRLPIEAKRLRRLLLPCKTQRQKRCLLSVTATDCRGMLY